MNPIFKSINDIEEHFFARDIFGNQILNPEHEFFFYDVNLKEIGECKKYFLDEMKVRREDNKVVQSLWVGGELSVLEYMSIQSFIDNGHEYHLYTYGDVKNVPSRAIVKDANTIIPEREVFQVKIDDKVKTYGTFSDVFRCRLLHQNGGWWVDLDLVCLKTFDFKDPYVFARQGPKNTVLCALKCPMNSVFLSIVLYHQQQVLERYHQGNIKDEGAEFYTQLGDWIVNPLIEQFYYQEYVQPMHVFNPIHWRDTKKLFEPLNSPLEFNEDVYSVHFWNDNLSRINIDKRANFDKNTIFEQLKKRYV